MVQARALLAAIALTVTVSPALAVPIPTCEEIREHAKNSKYTMKQIAAMAKRAGLTAEQWAAVKECLGEKK